VRETVDSGEHSELADIADDIARRHHFMHLVEGGFLACARVLPFKFSVRREAEAFEMQQPEPTKDASLMMSPSMRR